MYSGLERIFPWYHAAVYLCSSTYTEKAYNDFLLLLDRENLVLILRQPDWFNPVQEMAWCTSRILYTTKKDTDYVFIKNILYWLECKEKRKKQLFLTSKFTFILFLIIFFPLLRRGNAYTFLPFASFIQVLLCKTKTCWFSFGSNYDVSGKVKWEFSCTDKPWGQPLLTCCFVLLKLYYMFF